jgi:alkylated DNA repair protein alkB family protein 6
MPITMTDNAIDFQELFKQEKLRYRETLAKCKNSKKEIRDPEADANQQITTEETKHESYDPDLQPVITKLRHVSLGQYLISPPSLPFPHVYYIENCMDGTFSNSIRSWLRTLPREVMDRGCSNSSSFEGKWTRLKHAERNVALFDLNHAPYPILEKLVDALMSIEAFPADHRPNHVLINEYQGHEGIMPHTDGPKYFNRTATFSIGSGDVLLSFTPREEPSAEPTFQIKLHGTGSLVVFANDAYSKYCHGIKDRVESLVEYAHKKCVNCQPNTIVKRSHRISLTFRHKYNNGI